MKKFLAPLLVLVLALSGAAYAQSYGNSKTKTTPSKKVDAKPAPKPAAKPSASKAPASSAKPDIGSKPKSSSNSYDAAASRDRKVDTSQQKYEAAQARKIPTPAAAPKPTYTDSSGKSQPVKPEEAAAVRQQIDPDRYQTRTTRASTTFGTRYDRPTPTYSDRYDTRYYNWLRDRDEYTQARWAYNHRYEMDQARYNSFLANAAIFAYISQMERDNTPRNTSYVPAGIDPDLQYNSGYVDAVYNPETASASGPSTPMDFSWIGGCFKWLLILALLGALVYGIYWVYSNWESKVKWMLFKRPDAEETVQNPLKIKLGQYISLNTLDVKGSFHVDAISEWVRTLNGNTHRFTDYDLTDQGDTDNKVRLRMNPTAKPEFGLSQKVLMLKMVKDEEYNEGLHGVLTEEPEKDKPDDPDFIIYDDAGEEVQSQWWRINDVKGVYNSTRRVVVDRDGDGKADTELKNEGIEYWDFWRDRKNDDGIQEKEYLFIEMLTKGHWMQQWRGIEIDQSEVA